jgi:hypothetical protein
MKLQIFQSDKGDCLLLEGKGGGRVLCDGGMAASMRKHVRAELAKLRDQEEKLDFVYISHIDQDHISGVLALLEDELEWRLFDHHNENGSPIREPKVPRPPEIGGIWHNAFREQIGDNAGDVAELLAAASPPLLASAVPELVALGEELQQIAVSIPEAVKVSRFASPQLLDIPINKLPLSSDEPKLLMFRENQRPFSVGSLKFTIIGPTSDELNLLRDGWNNFLRDAANRQRLRTLKEQIKRKVDAFGEEAIDLRDWNGIEDFKGVTTPNIASLMFMVEDEDGVRLLLTGDSQQCIILKGLELAGFLDDGHLHVDILKVQHHGSENNVDEKFCRKVSADHYVFCGNGSHGNPELSVIETVFNSRQGPAATRALSPDAKNRDFSFWFSTSSDVLAKDSEQHRNFVEVEKLVAKLKRNSEGKLKTFFNENASRMLKVER